MVDTKALVEAGLIKKKPGRREGPGQRRADQSPDRAGGRLYCFRQRKNRKGGRKGRGDLRCSIHSAMRGRSPNCVRKILYTLMVIVIFRLGCVITVPYINADALTLFASGTGNMLDYLNMMSGGALSQCAIFALGVGPYINASIIMQLLTVAIPALERLSEEGEDGRRKLTRITRYVGGGIALAMAIGYYLIIRNNRWRGCLHHRLAGLVCCCGHCADLYRRRTVHHLAGGADRRQGHRQRRVAADLCGHYLPLEQRDHRREEPADPGGFRRAPDLRVSCPCSWCWRWWWWCSWSF